MANFVMIEFSKIKCTLCIILFIIGVFNLLYIAKAEK